MAHAAVNACIHCIWSLIIKCLANRWVGAGYKFTSLMWAASFLKGTIQTRRKFSNGVAHVWQTCLENVRRQIQTLNQKKNLEILRLMTWTTFVTPVHDHPEFIQGSRQARATWEAKLFMSTAFIQCCRPAMVKGEESLSAITKFLALSAQPRQCA